MRKLAAELTAAGHPVSQETVAKVLRQEGFSLQANSKTIEGGQHPDRDAQFSYLNGQAGQHLDAGDPVISVETKKKELVGQYKNGGAACGPKASQSRSGSTTSSVRRWARRTPTACMTSPPTPGGCR